jgi:hypothetical protein
MKLIDFPSNRGLCNQAFSPSTAPPQTSTFDEAGEPEFSVRCHSKSLLLNVCKEKKARRQKERKKSLENRI